MRFKAQLLNFICIFFLLSCEANYENKDIIYFGISQKPQNLDPRFASDAASEKINNLIYSFLIYFDENYKIKSDIVSHKLITDKEYKFTLQENLPSFHNGSVLDINDIIRTLENIRANPMSPLADDLKNIKYISKQSEHDFSINLKTPDINFLQKLHLAILPSELLNTEHNFSSQPVGSGLFKYISLKNKIRIQRISDDQIIEFIEIKDPTVRALKLIKGEIDIIQNDIPVEVVNFLDDQSAIKISRTIGSNISYLGFNFNDILLKDKRLRQAIAMSIDRKELIKYFLDKNTRIAEQLFPPEHWVSINLNPEIFNPDHARKIIKILSPDSRITLTFKTSTDPFRLKIATILQNQLDKVGIDLIIKTLDWGTYFQDIQNGNFQMYGLTWVGIKNPDIYYKIFHSNAIPPKGLNRGNFKSPKVDNLLNTSIKTNDWSNVIQEIQSSKGFFPLWFEGNIVAHATHIFDYKVHNDGNWDGLKTIRKFHE